MKIHPGPQNKLKLDPGCHLHVRNSKFDRYCIISAKSGICGKNIFEKLLRKYKIDQNQQISNNIIKTKEEAIILSNRIAINTPTIKGSVNLKGAILDDLILLNYNESLDKDSKNINLFLPDQTANPYYVELGWKSLAKDTSSIQLPDLNTEWSSSSSSLTPSSPITLYWTNKNKITFKIHFKIDENYLYEILFQVFFPQRYDYVQVLEIMMD